MILVWVTWLLVLHQGYTLVPVTTVQLGEPATFTCVLPDTEISRRRLRWYKQSAGGKLKLIMTLEKSAKPEYAPEFPESRWEVSNKNNFSNLTILKTSQEDEGMYHCEISEWIMDTIWSATYLLLKGNTKRTSNFTVVQRPAVSDPVHPGDLMTLQCSVLSDSDHKMCPGDHSVFWFRAGSDESHPNIIYTDGNRHGKCDKRSDTQKSCVYHFSKNVHSSDAGTYYCAVATCGEILFGNGTNLQIAQTSSYQFIALVITIVCLVISVIGNIVFICNRTQRAVSEQFEGTKNTCSQKRHDSSNQSVHDSTEDGDDLNYAALHLSGRRAASGKKKKEFKSEESVYAQVKYEFTEGKC